MNRREAKRIACLTAATWLDADIDAGAESFGGHDVESTEGQMVLSAMREVIRELARRGGWEHGRTGDEGS